MSRNRDRDRDWTQDALDAVCREHNEYYAQEYRDGYDETYGVESYPYQDGSEPGEEDDVDDALWWGS